MNLGHYTSFSLSLFYSKTSLSIYKILIPFILWDSSNKNFQVYTNKTDSLKTFIKILWYVECRMKLLQMTMAYGDCNVLLVLTRLTQRNYFIKLQKKKKKTNSVEPWNKKTIRLIQFFELFVQLIDKIAFKLKTIFICLLSRNLIFTAESLVNY